MFVFQHAEEWGIDDGKIIIAGESAGATLAAGVAFRAVKEVSIPKAHLINGSLDRISHRASISKLSFLDHLFCVDPPFSIQV